MTDTILETRALRDHIKKLEDQLKGAHFIMQKDQLTITSLRLELLKRDESERLSKAQDHVEEIV